MVSPRRVVYATTAAATSYLLVQTSNSSSEWVLPKGHIEAGEYPRETAVREVWEETRHWAKVRQRLDDRRLGADASAPMVRFYLMELIEADEPDLLDERQHRWWPLDVALKMASFEETRKLLQDADALRIELSTVAGT